MFEKLFRLSDSLNFEHFNDFIVIDLFHTPIID